MQQKGFSFFILTTLILTGCGQGLYTGGFAAKTIGLTTDTALIASYQITGTGSSLTATGSYTIPGVGSAPTNASLISAGGYSVTGTPLPPNETTVITTTTPGTFLSANNPDAAFTAHISVASTWPRGAIPSCVTMSPFSSFKCLLSGFTITQAALLGLGASGMLMAKGLPSNGGPNDFTLSNGLPAGVYSYKQVMDINGAGISDAIQMLIPYNNKLFILTSGNGIFSYNPSGTGSLAQVVHGGNSGSVTDPAGAPSIKTGFAVVCGSGVGQLYFQGTSAGGGLKLQYYDDRLGNGATLTNTTTNIATNDDIRNLTCYNNNVFFSATNSAGNRKLYKVNTATKAVTQMSNSNLAASDDALSWAYNWPIQPFYLWNNPATGHQEMIYTANNSNSVLKFFAYDDIAGTYLQVTNTMGATTADWDMSLAENMPATFNNKLYLYADPSTTGQEKMLVYDPTKSAGNRLIQISNTVPGGSDQGYNLYDNLLPYHGFMYGFMQDNDGANGFKLWKANTVAGQFEIVSNTCNNLNSNDYSYGGSSQYNRKTIIYNDKIYWVSLDATCSNYKMFTYNDATGTVQQFTDLVSGNSDLDTTYYDPWLTLYNNKLYFRANIASGISKMMVYDDTSKTLAIAANIGGSAVNNIDWTVFIYPVVVQNKLFFVGTPSTGGLKLYSICDQAAGCSN